MNMRCAYDWQQFRRRNPEDADEEEFMENVFDLLAAALTEPEIKKMFMDAEGIDLMVLMMKYVSLYIFDVQCTYESRHP